MMYETYIYIYTVSLGTQVRSFPPWTNLIKNPPRHTSKPLGAGDVLPGCFQLVRIFFPHSANGPWDKSLNFMFPTKHVIPKSLKFSHWLSEFRMSEQTFDLITSFKKEESIGILVNSHAPFFYHFFRGNFVNISIPLDCLIPPKWYLIYCDLMIPGRGPKTPQLTLPETNSSPLKMDGWNTIVSYWDVFFRAKTLVLGRVDLERLLRCKGTQKTSPNWWLKMVMFHHGRIHKKLTLNKSNKSQLKRFWGFQKERNSSSKQSMFRDDVSFREGYRFLSLAGWLTKMYLEREFRYPQLLSSLPSTS